MYYVCVVVLVQFCRKNTYQITKPLELCRLEPNLCSSNRSSSTSVSQVLFIRILPIYKSKEPHYSMMMSAMSPLLSLKIDWYFFCCVWYSLAHVTKKSTFVSEQRPARNQITTKYSKKFGRKTLTGSSSKTDERTDAPFTSNGIWQRQTPLLYFFLLMTTYT